MYDTCNFFVDPTKSHLFLNSNGEKLGKGESPFFLFGRGDVYTNRSAPDKVGITFEEFDRWNQFIWNITDNSHLLPCANGDLWCETITADTLYFTTMNDWNYAWTNGSCKGRFWKQSKEARGMGQVVHIQGYKSNLPNVEADPNGLLDPAVVADLQYAIGTLGRTMILAQFTDEQRVRSEGHSGITNVRGVYDGDDYYDDGTFLQDDGVASIYDISDNIQANQYVLKLDKQLITIFTISSMFKKLMKIPQKTSNVTRNNNVITL